MVDLSMQRILGCLHGSREPHNGDTGRIGSCHLAYRRFLDVLTESSSYEYYRQIYVTLLRLYYYYYYSTKVGDDEKSMVY